MVSKGLALWFLHLISSIHVLVLIPSLNIVNTCSGFDGLALVGLLVFFKSFFSPLYMFPSLALLTSFSSQLWLLQEPLAKKKKKINKGEVKVLWLLLNPWHSQTHRIRREKQGWSNASKQSTSYLCWYRFLGSVQPYITASQREPVM